MAPPAGGERFDYRFVVRDFSLWCYYRDGLGDKTHYMMGERAMSDDWSTAEESSHYKLVMCIHK